MTDPAVARLFLRHEPRPADLALAFGYHVPEGADRRARAAARLYLGGFVPRLLFSGGAPRSPRDEPEGARMARVALDMGVPPEALLVECFSRNTFENAVCSRVLLEQKRLLGSLSRVLLVSCPWHMGRVARIMRNTFGPAVELLCCPQQEECTAEDWECCEQCRRRVLGEADLLDHFIRVGLLAAEV
jgi:uncharacterized SAM-binding protein YcdF (DUF218 family)